MPSKIRPIRLSDHFIEAIGRTYPEMTFSAATRRLILQGLRSERLERMQTQAEAHRGLARTVQDLKSELCRRYCRSAEIQEVAGD